MKLKLLILLFLLSSAFSYAQTGAPKPIFQIGIGMTRIWFSDFRREDSARIEMSDNSRSNYLINEFTVIVLSDATKSYKVVKNIGAKFNDEVKQMFSTLKSSDTILISDITISDPLGKISDLVIRIFRVI